MTSREKPTPAIVHQRRPALALLAASCGTALAVIVGGTIGGLRINTTPSQPLGLWRIAPLDRPVQVGDMVFVARHRPMRFPRGLNEATCVRVFARATLVPSSRR